jgi:hypothetical protein
VKWILLFLLLPFSLKAQLSIGLNGGISRNRIISNTGSAELSSYEAVNGFSRGIMLRYDFSRLLSLGFEPSYLGKHYKVKRKGYYHGVYQLFHNQYLQLPVLISVSFHHRRIRATANFGVYAAYWLNSRRKGVIPNLSNLSLQATDFGNVFQNMQRFSYDEPHRFVGSTDRRWERGWTLGLDLAHAFDERLACYIAGKYYYALTNQAKTEPIRFEQRFNETLAVTLGLLVKTNRLKKRK